MGGEAGSIGLAEARSALAWWLEAGVDAAIQEQARDWLKPVPLATPAAPAPAPVPELEVPDTDTLDP